MTKKRKRKKAPSVEPIYERKWLFQVIVKDLPATWWWQRHGLSCLSHFPSAACLLNAVNHRQYLGFPSGELVHFVWFWVLLSFFDPHTIWWRVSLKFPFLLQLPCHLPLPQFAGTAPLSLWRGAFLFQSSLFSFSVLGICGCISSVASVCYPMSMSMSVSFFLALTVPENNELISMLIEYYL